MSEFNKRIQERLSELPTRSVAAGETLIKENASFDAVYFLKSGKVQISKGGADIAQVSEAGAVFGEMSYFLEHPAMATVRAVEDVEVYVTEEPGAFFMANPAVLVYVARSMAWRIDGLNEHLSVLKKQFTERGDDLSTLDQIVNLLIT